MKSREGNPVEQKTESVEHKRIRVNNEAQRRLWGLMCSPDQGQRGILDWIDHYSPSFEIVFKEVLARDPDFLNKWDSSETEKLNATEFFVDELKKLEGSRIDRAA